MNKVIISGRLTADPELRQTQSGNSVCSVTVAVDRRHDRDKSDFIPVVFWRQTAEFVAKYFGKGSPILIEGELQSRTYDAKDGTRRTAYEVIADEVEFFAANKRSEPTAQQTVGTENKPSDATFEPLTDDGDLPY